MRDICQTPQINIQYPLVQYNTIQYNSIQFDAYKVEYLDLQHHQQQTHNLMSHKESSSSTILDSVAKCPWTSVRNDDGVAVETTTTMVLQCPPMYRKTPRTGPRWKSNVHFHAQLKVGTDTSDDNNNNNNNIDRNNEEDGKMEVGVAEKKDEGAIAMKNEMDKTVKEEPKIKEEEEKKKQDPCSIILTWQAQAREGIAVALSPQPKYVSGKTYEIFYGDRDNTNTLIEKRSTTSSASDGAGTGKEKLQVSFPGRHCTETNWTMYWIALHQGRVYVGVGNEAPQQCLGVLVDNSESAVSNIWYVGMGNSSMKRPGERPFYNQYQNIRLSILDSTLVKELEALDSTTMQIPTIINVGDVDAETKALQVAYEEECRKARARAEKFGIPFKEPPKFLPQNKRRVQSSSGLATGMDLQDPEEQAKQQARKERFGLVEDAVVATSTDVDMDDIVPVTQAWDNEKLVSNQRVDPPKQLWKVVPTESDSDPFAPVVDECHVVPEKIHLFAIDWAAFLQIRTNDLSAYFSLYSPTHVEWLGDLRCNIHFADKFSAARALHNLSQEIPTPPPSPPQSEGMTRDDDEGNKNNNVEPPADLGAMGWRLGRTLLRKVSDDRFGRKGTAARVLLRLATSHDTLRDTPSSSSQRKTRPPPGFSKTRVLGPGSDFPTKKKNKNKRNRDKREDVPVGAGADADAGAGAGGTTGEPSLLRGSLKASRSGFSVEEMEAERAQKRAKITDEG